MMKPINRNKERAVADEVQTELFTEETKRMSLDMPLSLHTEFKALCASRNVKMREVLLSEVRRWVHENKKLDR